MSDSPNPYDEIPYGETAHPQTHPARIAAIATLLGLTPAPVERCRVLELGCATGMNLIPMAYTLPDSRFVGVDYSPRQIDAGRTTAAALGLTNLDLRALDIRDMDESFGQFDYIIAHGLYSWIPPDVQDKALDICRHNLAPNGVAYVSYNCYPGWRLFEITREAMLFHTRRAATPSERASEARAFIDFLGSVPDKPAEPFWDNIMHAYRTLMQMESNYLATKPDNVLLHDEMEAIAAPLYFRDFAERAARHDLAYLGEMNLPPTLLRNQPEWVAQYIRHAAADAIEVEQYLDFAQNRAFRQSLLVHADAALEQRLTPERLNALHLSSEAHPVNPPKDRPGAAAFAAEDGTLFVTDDPLVRAAFDVLIDRYPLACDLDALTDTALEQTSLSSLSGTEAKARIAASLLEALSRSLGLIEPFACPLPGVTAVSAYPVMSPVARWQAGRGAVVTNLRHENVELDDMGCLLAPLLDGTRDHAALLAALRSAELSEGVNRANLEAELDDQLDWLGRCALLVG